MKQVRDQTLSRLKSKIELMYVSNGYKKVVVVPHSMGANYFLHFMKWVESAGGGGRGWCAKHIKSIMNIGPVFLGVPKAVSSILSAESKDVAFLRYASLSFDLCSEIEQYFDMIKLCAELWHLVSWIPRFFGFKPWNMSCVCRGHGTRSSLYYLKVERPFGATWIGLRRRIMYVIGGRESISSS